MIKKLKLGQTRRIDEARAKAILSGLTTFRNMAMQTLVEEILRNIKDGHKYFIIPPLTEVGTELLPVDQKALATQINFMFKRKSIDARIRYSSEEKGFIGTPVKLYETVFGTFERKNGKA